MVELWELYSGGKVGVLFMPAARLCEKTCGADAARGSADLAMDSHGPPFTFKSQKESDTRKIRHRDPCLVNLTSHYALDHV